MSAWLAVLLATVSPWVLDRWEGEWAVLTDGVGHVRDVPRSELPPGSTPGTRLTEPSWRANGSDRPLIRRVAHRRGRLLALARRGEVRQGSAVKNRPDHRQDHFFHKAKKEGYAARSIYKLEEIDRKYRVLRRGQRVLDLGCAPGSWLQYAAGVLGPQGTLVGIDLKAVELALPAHVRLLQGDAFETPAELLMGGGGPFDVVLSDMAPATMGNRFTDHMRSMELCHRVLAVADTALVRGGSVVCKAFEGEDLGLLAEAFRHRFGEVRRLKPKGTRTESVEVFFIGLGFQGPGEVPAGPDAGGEIARQ